MATLKQLEAKLTAQQRKACLYLVDKDLNPDAEFKTELEIAEAIGVDRTTLYRWRKQNPDFIAYKNLLADDMLAEERSMVYAQLIRMIQGSQPSIKAMDLYFKRFGLLSEKLNIETTETSSELSEEARSNRVEELRKRLQQD